MHPLLEPFAYDYLVTALWVGALVGGVCGALSGFVTLRGWSLLGDALSHAVVPGVAIAHLLGLPFALGAFISGLLAAGAMSVLKQRIPVREDAVIGVVFTAFFALGLLLISLFPASLDLKTILFGNLLAIEPDDARQLVGVAGFCLVAVALKWRDLRLVCFDPRQAQVLGLPARRLQLLLLLLLAGVTVAALQAVGAVLVTAMLVTPGATAHLLTDRFGRMLWLGGGIGAATAALGAYASYFLDGATGGCIVVLQTLVFLAVLTFAPRHGLLAARRARLRLLRETPAATA